MDKKEMLNKLEMQRFGLSMKDRWTEADYEKDRELAEEIRKLKAEL